MKTAIANFDYTTCNLHNESFTILFKKIRTAADYGYISYENLLSYKSVISQLHTSITNAEEKILDINRTTLYSIIPVLDHLKLFLTEESMGVLSLLSKEMNEAMISKYGINNVRLYIIKHYLKSGNNNDTSINFFHNDRLIVLEMRNHIIMKRQLRILLGCEKYFQDPDNYEIFFMSDLKYVLEMFATKGICTKILLPKTICIICKEVKSIDNVHHTCFDAYMRTNNMLHRHNKTYNTTSNYYESDNGEDNFDPCEFGNSAIDYEKKFLCEHYYKSRLFTCEYMYPELIFHFDENNFFPAPHVLKSEIVPCEKKKLCYETCMKCYYFISTKYGTQLKEFYTSSQHNKIWDCFRTNTLPAKTKNECKGIYQIPIKCITDKISDLTPCDICTFPRFFHNINFDK